MNGVEALRSAFQAAHFWYDGTVADVTPEQAFFVPPGRTHPIGELMAHTLQSEDGIIQGMVQGKAPIWEAESWSEKLGIPNVMSHTAETARSLRVDPAVLSDYRDRVYAATDAFFDGLSDEDLDRDVDFSAWGLGMIPLGAALTRFTIGNTFAHTGEISALKGIQGAQGYPF